MISKHLKMQIQRDFVRISQIIQIWVLIHQSRPIPTNVINKLHKYCDTIIL